MAPRGAGGPQAAQEPKGARRLKLQPSCFGCHINDIVFSAGCVSAAA